MNEFHQKAPEAITVLGYADDAKMDRGLFSKRLVRKTVDLQELENEVKTFLAAMERIIGSLNQQVGKYQMDSITVSAEVNAKGKVSLLGSGGEMGGKGGLSFTFKRPTGS